MKCIYEERLNDANFCSVANFYCTLEQKTNCKKKKVKEKKQTNFDRIKAMSVEELAKEFAEVFFHSSIMEKPIIGWLESEVQGE